MVQKLYKRYTNFSFTKEMLNTEKYKNNHNIAIYSCTEGSTL